MNPNPLIWTDYVVMAKALGNAGGIVSEICKRTGISRQTAYRHLKKNGFDSGRKSRKDEGIPEKYLPSLMNLARIIHKKVGKDGKTRSNIPTDEAVEILKDNSVEGTVCLPGISMINRYLKLLKISRRDVKMATPHVHLKSRYSNHVWQLDSSVCRWYLKINKKKAREERNKIVPLSKGELYKNKPFETNQKTTFKVYRWIICDHLSNAFFVCYTLSNDTLAVADVFYKAMEAKGNFIFHGVPEILILDNDKAMRSKIMLDMYDSLEIKIPPVQPYNSRAKGSVEGLMRYWETRFETRLLYYKNKSIDEINAAAFDFAIHLQTSKRVARHGLTRFAMWDKHIVDHLREAPEYRTFQTLLHTQPISRQVDANGEFSYKGEDYKIRGIKDTKVDITEHLYLYSKNSTVTVTYPSKESNPNNYISTESQKMIVAPKGTDAVGFAADGIFWEDYLKLDESKTQKVMKQVENGAAEFDDKIEPFKGIKEKAEKVEFIARTGTPTVPVSQVEIPEKMYSKIQVAMQLVRRLKRNLLAEEIQELETINAASTVEEPFNENDLDRLFDKFAAGAKTKTG